MSGPPDLRKRLADLQREQEARRTFAALTCLWDPKELRALARLAHELWGDAGVVEFRGGETGIARMGYRRDNSRRGDGRLARCRWVFKGATHKEITDQVLLYRQRRS